MNDSMQCRDGMRSTNALLIGLMTGAAVGGALALLFAPRQGSGIRHDLASGAQRAGRRLRDGYDTVCSTVRERGQQLSDRVHDFKDDVSAHVGDAARSAEEAVDAAASAATRTARRVRHAVEDATRA